MNSAAADVDSHSPEERLANLGVNLPPAPQPVAVYVPAVRSGNLIYSSGQLPIVDGTVAHPGKVGADVTLEQAQEAARLCALNALAAIRPLAGDLSAIKRVVKVVGFVASTADFTSQPSVINGASQLLGDVFGASGEHARSAVGVAALPLDAPVEIEIVVEV
ncbi:RidA family protein [Paenarthrobacter aurescens]|jgi:enamine deaminase RidA (YjgF/YER057c/UK114 family)|uniref:Endoribonuclease L-PSP family n=1 Tax=Paenarthrobacter aurescens (strain TC1) TaxID=290340 RepID=A1RDM1_PAEAT|nr:RidA family protein [Paenarthrobacter aurescens]ABM10678.1 putative endoribonuclease L-PSP family [Paenarthrobacter aurescens TC1]